MSFLADGMKYWNPYLGQSRSGGAGHRAAPLRPSFDISSAGAGPGESVPGRGRAGSGETGAGAGMGGVGLGSTGRGQGEDLSGDQKIEERTPEQRPKPGYKSEGG
jgi:hypothetical protein